MNKILTIISSLGVLAASMGSSACLVVFVDEPEMPKSLIK